QWQAALHAGNLTIFVVTVLQVALDAIELIDQVQCDVSASCFALGLYFLRFDELAARVRPAAQSLQSVLCSQRVVTGVVVGHDKDHWPIRWAAGLYPHPGLAAGL